MRIPEELRARVGVSAHSKGFSGGSFLGRFLEVLQAKELGEAGGRAAENSLWYWGIELLKGNNEAGAKLYMEIMADFWDLSTKYL